MSLQEIQYSYLDSAKEMFACGLVLLCVTVEISRFESLAETQVGCVPQTMSTAVVKLHWRYARELYGVFGKLEET